MTNYIVNITNNINNKNLNDIFEKIIIEELINIINGKRVINKE